MPLLDESQPRVLLNSGASIPQLGVGVYQVPEGEAALSAVRAALEAGYRHIDTAHAYGNERSVGRAIRESGVAREEVWITSKLWPSEYGRGTSSAAIDAMLARLRIDSIDLLLLHQQVGDYLGAWADMEDAVADGRVGSIGLSNFEGERLEEVLASARIMPAALQVECHPYLAQDALRTRIGEFGGVIESWYPLGHGHAGLLAEPVFARIGERVSKTPAQVILRWHLEKGTIVFPRATNPLHIAENADLLDFSLTREDMEAIAALDSGRRFFTMSLAEQEAAFTAWSPED